MAGMRATTPSPTVHRGRAGRAEGRAPRADGHCQSGFRPHPAGYRQSERHEARLAQHDRHQPAGGSAGHRSPPEERGAIARTTGGCQHCRRRIILPPTSLPRPSGVVPSNRSTPLRRSKAEEIACPVNAVDATASASTPGATRAIRFVRGRAHSPPAGRPGPNRQDDRHQQLFAIAQQDPGLEARLPAHRADPPAPRDPLDVLIAEHPTSRLK